MWPVCTDPLMADSIDGLPSTANLIAFSDDYKKGPPDASLIKPGNYNLFGDEEWGIQILKDGYMMNTVQLDGK